MHSHPELIQRLAHLFHHKWSAPILAELLRAPGVTVSALSHRLGGSRGAMRDALDRLCELGWVSRLGGHRHPLAPEYVLGKESEALAESVTELLSALESDAQVLAVRRKWPGPVLGALADEGLRHTELRRRVPGITDRALGMALGHLRSSDLVRHQVAPDFPPVVVLYVPTPGGRRLQPLIRAIAPLAVPRKVRSVQ